MVSPKPTHVEREIVDLLFFPTGGGKTEAYLGLSAFTLVLRRLRTPDPAHRGLSVLMRYTLRLLTLDQLGRAAALVCALELEREKASHQLGEWPFEIALWVAAPRPRTIWAGRRPKRQYGPREDSAVHEGYNARPAAAAQAMSMVRHALQQVFIPAAPEQRCAEGPSYHLRQPALRLQR